MITNQPALQELSEGVRQCVPMCADCHLSCLATMRYGLQQGGPHADQQVIRLLYDCAQMCQLCVTVLHSSPDLESQIFQACADYCGRCAEVCDSLADDPQFQACGELCRQCAKGCRGAGGAAA